VYKQGVTGKDEPRSNDTVCDKKQGSTGGTVKTIQGGFRKSSKMEKWWEDQSLKRWGPAHKMR